MANHKRKLKLDGTPAKSNAGRPTAITPEVIAKLEQAFAIDATVEEACSYAEVSRDAFYDHLKVNPAFSDRIAELRERPILKARQTIVKHLDNPSQAQWYIERKRRQEFSTRVETDLTTKGEKLDSGADVKELSRKFDEWFKQQNA